MKIVGIANNSFIDYPGKIAMVLFTYGCNMNCYYCHNRDIIGKVPPKVVYTSENILQEIDKKKDFLDGVVISGGEPTLNADLPDFIKRIKEKNMLIKLDTNGTNPKMLQDLINDKLIDFIAMDIKAPKEKYSNMAGWNEQNGKELLVSTEKSIQIIKKSGIPYEFRTTFAPTLSKEDIISIANWLVGEGLAPPEKYVIQQYRPPQTKHIDTRLSIPPHSKEYLEQTLANVQNILPNSSLRGI